jgi:tetratricopeptide (TPR) repeat protein
VRPYHFVGRKVLSLGIGWLLGILPVNLSEGAFDRPAAEVTAASLSTQNSPDPATFQQILRTYRTGRAQEAINELAAWPVDRLAAAAKASTPTLSSSDRMAAADLQAEVANALLAVQQPKGSAAAIRQTNAVLKVIDSALVLLRDAGRAPFGEQLGEEPRRSWYYAVVSVLIASYRLPEASSLVDIGLAEFPNDPLLLTARGTISSRRAFMQGLPAENAAIADYKRAITLAPNLAIARLRLGQLYLERGFGREAGPWVQSVAAGAATDNQQYFAHLLLGRIAANEHELEVSDAEYQKAYSIGAGYQTACIALSRREEVLEHQERAADIAEDCLRLSDHDDPWAYYRAKGDPDALPHLRAEARER